MTKAEIQAIVQALTPVLEQSKGMNYVQQPSKPSKLTLKAKDLGPSERAKNPAEAKARYKTEHGTLYFDKPLAKGSTITITIQ